MNLSFKHLASLALGWRRGEFKWSLDTLTTCGFAVGIMSLLAAAGMSYHLTTQLEESAAWVSHTQEVLKEIGDVTAGLASLGSSQRSYINTGNDVFQKQDESFKEAIRTKIASLHKLTADNPRQSSRLIRLARLVAQRIDWGEQTIAARQQGGLSAAEQLIATGRGIGLTDSIRHLIAQLQDEEYTLLKERQKRERDTSSATFRLLPLGALLSITLLSLGLLLLNTGMGERAQAEEKSAWLASFPERNPNPIVELDLVTGIIHYLNSAAAGMLPDLPTQGLGHPWLAGLPEIAKGFVDRPSEPLRREIEVGGRFYAQTISYISETRRVRVYGSDISGRKQLEAAAARLAAIVEFSDDAIIGKDLQGIITSWNRGAEALFGYTAEEMVGQPLTRLIPAERQQEEADILDRVRSGKNVPHFETVRLRKDGTTIPLSITVSAIRDSTGKVVGASKVARDITERKQVEDQIRELNASLEQRVTERTAQLESSNRELEAFSYSVSHDLRAPLRAVDGFSQAVLEDYGPHLPEECKQDLQTIRGAAQKMGELIDDLLAFSRLSRMDLTKRGVDIGKMVRDTLQELGFERHLQRVAVRIAELPECQADPVLLKQVWINLLSNALKYTGKREQALVEIGCTLEGGHNTYFVRDNGTGFDMKYVHKLFGVFQRLHRAEEYEGTGVGLAIVQRIVHRHGGRVWAEAAEGRGATFFFTLEGNTLL